MWSNDSCSIEERDNSPAAEHPAWEADEEGFEILDKALVRRKVSVWQVSDRVDARLSLKFFS